MAKPEDAMENIKKNAAAFFSFDDDLLWRFMGANCKLDLRRFYLVMGSMVKGAKNTIRQIHTRNTNRPDSDPTILEILRIEKTPIMQELMGITSTHYVQQLFGPVDVKIPQDFPL